jgi:hypothetical protein
MNVDRLKDFTHVNRARVCYAILDALSKVHIYANLYNNNLNPRNIFVDHIGLVAPNG